MKRKQDKSNEEWKDRELDEIWHYGLKPITQGKIVDIYKLLNFIELKMSHAIERARKEGESFKGKAKREAYQLGYKEGRQSVIDEWKNENDKLVQGFSYPKSYGNKKV